MLRSIRLYLLTGENRLNTCASLMLLLVFAVFHWNSDPEACGGDPIASARRSTPLLLVSIAKPVPVKVQSIQQALEQVEVPELVADSASPPAPHAAPAEPKAHSEEVIPSPAGTVLNGRVALQASHAQLVQGKLLLERTSDYSAQFKRQERIAGSLLDPQAMNLKVRHEPFSLYMKWTEGDKGRQLIYVQGQNENKVLVQIGGMAGRLTGALAMSPDDHRILAESRYPATSAGLLELTKIILTHHETNLERGTGVVSEIRDGESFDNRPCFLTTLVYENPTVNADYYKSLILIDKELCVPVNVKNFTWINGQAPATDDEESLIESYSYTGLRINTQLSDNDFEKSKYKMR